MASLLCLDAVSKSHWRGAHRLAILTEATLRVAAGEIVTVWGMHSQGKTTLLRIAAGMERPDDGTVKLEGIDLAGLPERKLSRLMGEQIGWVSRSGPRLAVSMLDYVALPLLIGPRKRAAHLRAMEALERFGIAQCADQRWESLSDWERVRVAIAHAVVRTPKLLLVDDLAANLGIREVNDLTLLLATISREAGTAILMTVSDMNATLRSERTLTLGGGRLSDRHDTAAEVATNVINFPGTERSV